jgi:hypothetical protein
MKVWALEICLQQHLLIVGCESPQICAYGIEGPNTYVPANLDKCVSPKRQPPMRSKDDDGFQSTNEFALSDDSGLDDDLLQSDDEDTALKFKLCGNRFQCVDVLTHVLI